MTNTLTAYCLISKGTRITCTNLTGSKINTVLSTRGGVDLKDNFTLIFGLKSWQSMLEIKVVEPSEEVLAEFNLSTDAVAKVIGINEEFPFKFEGFVSSCAHGQGRSCADRQYYFINGRPCDPIRVSKLVNEIYRGYNRHQYPCIVLNITTRSNEIDINVTPDKRQLMVTNEKLLLATVKASLERLYQDVPNTFALQNTSLSYQQQTSCDSTADTAPLSVRTSLAAFAAGGGNSWKSSLEASPLGKKRKLIASPPVPKQQRLDNFVTRQTEFKVKLIDPVELISLPNKGLSPPLDSKEVEEPRIIKEEEEVKIIETAEELEDALDEILLQQEATPVQTAFVPPTQASSRITFTVQFSVESLRRKSSEDKAAEPETGDGKRFLARISPDDAKAAEAELSRQICQTDFEKMEVIGQFNLGFIIARLNSDLFIVDQHASDEKYNFETLQRTTQLQSQKLVCPKPLNLTAAKACLLTDNVDIFRRNGFDFTFNENVEATQRVLLSSVPMSGNWIFGPDDVDELLFMLEDSPFRDDGPEGNQVSPALIAHYRPSKVRAMFASRACRKAVMVGDALTSVQMKKLLNQMGQLKQPWNCPHGRPTMRHLINMDMLR